MVAPAAISASVNVPIHCTASTVVVGLVEADDVGDVVVSVVVNEEV